MHRVIWLVMDSFGIGGADDAAAFGDESSDTFGSISQNYQLSLPHMTSLGLLKAYELNNNKTLPLSDIQEPLKGSFWGSSREQSAGKDTLSGHWEMAGVEMDLELRYFTDTEPTFPEEMISDIISKSDIEGILGNRHASGLEVIDALGQKHISTGYPIFYTSADSVLQIAAHEESFGLERLYRLCEICREVTDSYGVGRVIARPFIGEDGSFTRTKNRRDYALRPSGKSVLEFALEQGRAVVGVGKIHDIFGGYGIGTKRPAYTLEGLMDETLAQMQSLKQDGIIFTNFVDFDMEWGHRRDVEGYARGLEYFDSRLIEVIEALGKDDLLIITADHGCDPTFTGTDHTRENVPVFGMLKSTDIGEIGIRDTFADMAATVSTHLDTPHAECGESFL